MYSWSCPFKQEPKVLTSIIVQTVCADIIGRHPLSILNLEYGYTPVHQIEK